MAQSRFFVDENDLALGKALSGLRGGVVYPGHPDLPAVPRGSLDDKWLPVIGRLRLVVITRDGKIRYRPVEKLAWVTYGVRGFYLTGRRSQSTQQSLELILAQWSEIEDLDEKRPEGPWMFSLVEGGVREILLS